jgi:hypothetical protein
MAVAQRGHAVVDGQIAKLDDPRPERLWSTDKIAP